MDLVTRVYETIRHHRMISPGDSVLLGVSGGPDSVALLHVLDELKAMLGCTLAVAHFDHGIRGAEGREDAVFTQALAARLGLPCYLGKNEGVPFGAGSNLEAEARAARYRFLDATAKRGGLTRIAVGHTQDDQAETILMWLLRGCGSTGLGGMPPVRALESGRGARVLVRPLLEASRADIVRYLQQRQSTFRDDSTNVDTRYLRNWIRVDLLPQLVQRTDARLKIRLARLSTLLQGDEQLMERYVSTLVGEVVDEGILRRSAFLELDAGVRRRVLRFWFRETFGHLRGIGFQHVDLLARLIAGDRPSGRVALPSGWTAVRNYDVVRLTHEAPDSGVGGYVYDLPVEGELRVPEAGVTVRTWCSSRAAARIPEDGFQAIFDLSCVQGIRQLRNRRPGDRFRPLGMAGHKKIKDLFIQQKVARSVRSRLPLLLVGNEVLWIPGCGRSDRAKVGPGTREVWNIAISPIDLGRAG